MRKVLTELEKLDGSHPGLLVKVKQWFDQGTIAAEIPQLIHDEFGLSVTETMAENYRSKRWAPEKERIEARKEAADAAIQAFGGDAGFDSLLLAKLWELMDKMTIPQLLTARSLFVKIKAQNLKEQEFLFKTGQLKPARSEEEQEADSQAQQRKVLHRIKEIFGLAGDEPPKPRAPLVPVAAGDPLPKEVGKSPAEL